MPYKRGVLTLKGDIFQLKDIYLIAQTSILVFLSLVFNQGEKDITHVSRRTKSRRLRLTYIVKAFHYEMVNEIGGKTCRTFTVVDY